MGTILYINTTENSLVDLRVFYFISKCDNLSNSYLDRTLEAQKDAETPENPVQSREKDRQITIMSKRKITAILVDAENQKIERVCIKPRLRNYYQIIAHGCSCIGMFNYEGNVDIIHDDEGLYNADRCVILDNLSVMFGNLLFVDIDPETGDTISTSMTVDEVKEIVRFPNEVDSRSLMNYYRNSATLVEFVPLS
jgi:hypothetical protein